jgi:hypothetical protein
MLRITMHEVTTLPNEGSRLASDGYSYEAYLGRVYFKPSCGFEQAVAAVRNMRTRYLPSALFPSAVLLANAIKELANGKSEFSMEQRICTVKRLAQVNVTDDVVHPYSKKILTGQFWENEHEEEEAEDIVNFSHATPSI